MLYEKFLEFYYLLPAINIIWLLINGMCEVLLHDTLIIETLVSNFFFVYFSTLMNVFYVTGCNVYTYGSDCIHCGNCSGGVQCNHVTGTCRNGCDADIYGDKCDLGNVKIKFLFIKKITAFNVKLCCFSTNCIF